MNARSQKQETGSTVEARLLSLEDLCTYLGLGRAKAVQFGKKHGANRSFGRRVVYDRKIIDAALDNLTE